MTEDKQNERPSEPSEDGSEPSETQPLLGRPVLERRTSIFEDKKFAGSYTFNKNTGMLDCGCPEEQHRLAEKGIVDAMSYHTDSLTSWGAFCITYTSIWTSFELWSMMLRLLSLAILISIIVVCTASHPEWMKLSKFTEVSKFLNVVVGLLLGFFMSSAVSRWHQCVDGFLELLDAVRNLSMQLTALGVPDKETNLCMRYCFASAWLLYGQLLLDTYVGPNKEYERESMWKAMSEKWAPLGKAQERLLTQDEIAFLKTARDPPGIMFMWTAALIGNLAQNGWIPPMASPTYGRIMNLCQNGHAGIRQVKASVTIQTPLSYAQMLATIVHLNNLLNAVTLGMVAGLCYGSTWHDTKGELAPISDLNRTTHIDMQNMVVTGFYCTLGPILYQALLTIGMHLSRPFSGEDSRMPLHRLCFQLELDLVNGRDSIEHICFQKPAFKQPPKPAEV